jgi:hypothetical protein
VSYPFAQYEKKAFRTAVAAAVKPQVIESSSQAEPFNHLASSE